jgi:hypothetical protein
MTLTKSIWVVGVVLALAIAGGCVTEPTKPTTKADFVGSERCSACHQQEYKTWKSSLHANMVRPRDVGMLKDAAANWASDGKNPGPTKANLTGTPAKQEDVTYVIGSHWKQRYMVKDPATGGQMFLDKQWNRMTKAWEPYGQKNDWDTNCSTCHTTGFRVLAYDEKNPAAQKVTWSELNVGCEACHGPGAKHAASHKKADIYTFTDKPKAEQTKVCGYCHIRLENELYHTAQGAPAEYLPHPVIGQTYQPADDWTKWYPDKAIIPGVHPEDKIDATYKGDLAGMFKLDEQSKKNGIYDAGKHHQQYQEYLQSKHYQSGILSCSDCHSSHGGAKPVIVAANTCKGCHDATYTVDKYMPGTGSTAAGLFVRTHTFDKGQARPKALTATSEAVLQNPPK